MLGHGSRFVLRTRGPIVVRADTQCDNETDPEQSDNMPCYLIFEAPDECPDAPTQLTLRLFPDRACLPGRRTLSVRCAVQ